MPIKLERKHACPLALTPLLIALGLVLFKLLTANQVTNPETGRRIRVGLSPEQENRLGLEAYVQVRKDEASNLIINGTEFDLVKRVTKKLAQATVEKTNIHYEWDVSVVKSIEKNAFCLPGGKIIVYTGIIPISKNEAGLATVLGHEMAHATSRHGAERLFRSELIQTIVSGIHESLTEIDPEKRKTIIGLLGAGTKYGVSLPFSREQELEADQIGLLYMARAGFNPQEAISFWQRMNEQSNHDSPPEFLSSHPSHTKRIKQLHSWMRQAQEEYQRHQNHLVKTVV